MDYTTKKKKGKIGPESETRSPERAAWGGVIEAPVVSPRRCTLTDPGAAVPSAVTCNPPFKQVRWNRLCGLRFPRRPWDKDASLRVDGWWAPEAPAGAWVAGSQFQTPDGEGHHHSSRASRGSHRRLGPRRWSGGRPEAQGGRWGRWVSFCGDKCSGDASNISRVY